jgi:hypothetical protein
MEKAMLIAPFQMPVRTDGPSNHFLQYNLQLTNLETVDLTFRVVFSSTISNPVRQLKAVLDQHVHLTGVIDGQSKKWITKGNACSIQGDVRLAAGQTGVVTLFGQGPIPDPLQNLQVFLHDGLRGTTAITVPPQSGSPGSVPTAQIGHPAHVLAFAFLKPAGYSGARAFLPPIGGSPEFFIPAAVVSGSAPKRAAPKRKAARRRAR